MSRRAATRRLPAVLRHGGARWAAVSRRRTAGGSRARDERVVRAGASRPRAKRANRLGRMWRLPAVISSASRFGSVVPVRQCVASSTRTTHSRPVYSPADRRTMSTVAGGLWCGGDFDGPPTGRMTAGARASPRQDHLHRSTHPSHNRRATVCSDGQWRLASSGWTRFGGTVQPHGLAEAVMGPDTVRNPTGSPQRGHVGGDASPSRSPSQPLHISPTPRATEQR